MEPSKYQQAIYEAMGSTENNLAVEAVAGSGKSTTLKHGLGYLPQNQRVAMFAFNKDIVTALQTAMGSVSKKPTRLDIQTINSFGWQICRKELGSRTIDKFKNDNILKSVLEPNDPRYFKWKGIIGRLIALMKANCVFLNGDPQEWADRYGLDIPNNPEFLETFKTVWEIAGSPAIMDFSDQIYMPLKKNLSIPKYDTVLVDELQDLNPAQQNLLLGAAKRFIGVGDSRQAIYAFAGADARSLKNMIDKTGATRLPLSICYRCPKNVVREAQKIVPEIEFSPTAPDGIVASKSRDQFRSKAKAGDFVLCRTTAPLVSECLKMIREGKRAMVKGKDIGEQLIYLIEKLGVKPYQESEALYDAISRYHVEETQRLSRASRTELIDALNDKVETIKVILEACPTVNDVIARIKSIFSDQTYGVVFSTIHKAKGLESLCVWILRPDLLPHPNAKTPEAMEQEMNLKYVAVTRVLFDKSSDGELYWVE